MRAYAQPPSKVWMKRSALPFVRLAGSNGSSRERFPSPIRFKTAETVESGMPKISAISAAVIRSLRSSSIARTRSTGVRRGIRCGAEERSTSPALPLAAIAAQPFRCCSNADASSLSRSGDRPTLLEHSLDDQQPRMQAGPGVTVKPHLGPPLEAGGIDNHQPPGRPG
jgi:hypothetical protein